MPANSGQSEIPVCSPLERQDRMNEDLFLKLNDFGYRPHDLEMEVQGIKQRGRL